MNKIFQVSKGRILSSEHYQKNFHEGEVIDLSFASDEDCQALLDSGAVEHTTKKPEEKKKPEVTNG